MISVLREVGGPDMTGETAECMLRRAHAWESVGARQLATYLSEHNDAFVAPSPHIPLAMATLFKLLADNGFGDRVVLPGCVRCGRTDKVLKRPTPEGRCCERCMERVERRMCARCGKIGRIVGQRKEGGICRPCYRRDPARHAECSQCGRSAAIIGRTKEGAPLCNRCKSRPKKPCVHCGRIRIVCANTAKGPLCKNCHSAPPRQCGVCGKVRTITRRGDGGNRPDMCQSCSRDTGECVRCGRHRRGSCYRGGPFYCGSCYPKTPRSCSICQSVQPVTAVWPVGPVCQRCYRTRLERPETCAGCLAMRILVCVNESGDAVCTRCGGVDLNFACKDCGEEGPGFRNGRCDRCSVLAKVNTLLGGKGSVSDARRQPLFAALAEVSPGSVHTWVGNNPSLAWLAELARTGRGITHEEIDRLPQNAQTLHIRAAFVAAGVLPQRNEALAQLQLWVDRTVPTIPAEHQSVIRAYAEWHIVRRARRRAARGPFRPDADSSNRQRIRCAINFLGWLAEADVSVADLRQHHVDTYFAAGSSNLKALSTFLAWMQTRRLISDLEIPRKKDGLPSRFQDQDDQTDQLRRCDRHRPTA
ncbi:MAG: XRE family transcriptional regulator [Mycobacterium sp.]